MSDDIRLQAGRHHLANADRALHDGAWDDARNHLEGAMLQFRGPDLVLGEAHAHRGLASVELGSGDLDAAEHRLQDSIRCYREVRSILDRVDEQGSARSLRDDAMEGEAAAQVLLGELLLRMGRETAAREARDWARAAFDAVGHRQSEAGLLALTARLAMRDGELDEAGQAYGRALAIHERYKDVAGQAMVLRAMAEVARLEADFPAASGYLKRALTLAQQLGDRRTEARCLAGLGSVARQTGDVESAELAYEQVLELAESSGDREMAGFAHLNLGEVHSRQGQPKALSHLREAVGILGALGVHHAVGAAMHHTAAHALTLKRYDVALAAAESARRTWRGMDPVRGVGQALKLQVKALAGLREWRAVVATAQVRADLAGDLQPHAEKVRDHYRQRAPEEWLEALDAASPTERVAEVEAHVQTALEPFLTRHALAITDLGSLDTARTLLDILATSDDPALRRPDLPEIAFDELEEVPQEDPFFVVVLDDTKRTANSFLTSPTYDTGVHEEDDASEDDSP
jgi:tetratricopeptide (TPR) repeat protein